MKKLALLAQPFIQWPLSFFSFSFGLGLFY